MKYVYFIAHLFLILTYWTSPFWLNWEVVLFVSLIYLLISNYLKYCPLTKLQFSHTQKGFQQHYLSRLGLNLSDSQNAVFTRWLTPIIISFIALIWQLVLK